MNENRSTSSSLNRASAGDSDENDDGTKSPEKKISACNDLDACDKDDDIELHPSQTDSCKVNLCPLDVNNCKNSYYSELSTCGQSTTRNSDSQIKKNVSAFFKKASCDASSRKRKHAERRTDNDTSVSVVDSVSAETNFETESIRFFSNSTNFNLVSHQTLRPSTSIFSSRGELDLFDDASIDEEDLLSEEGRGSVTILRPIRLRFSLGQLLSQKFSSVPWPSPRLRIIIDKSKINQCKELLDLIEVIKSSYPGVSKLTKLKDGNHEVLIDRRRGKEHSDNTFKVFNDDKKVDIFNCDKAVKECPMYPGGSGNKMQGTYRFSTGTSNHNAGSQSGFQSNLNSSQPYRPSRPGFSNLLNNVSSVDLSPFRSGPPIRFRLGIPPRLMTKKQFNSPSTAPPLVSSTPQTSSESPPREDEDVDLYSDIEQNPQPEVDEDKNFGTLEPPPEPPAMLMGLSVSGDDGTDEEEGLVIDDKGDMYDPAEPCDEDSNDGNGLNEAVNLTRSSSSYLLSPTYNDIVAQQSTHDEIMRNASGSKPLSVPNFDVEMKMMEPPPLPPELLSKEILNHKESNEDEEECPNFSLYSSASMNLVKKSVVPTVTNSDILDIPIPDAPSLSSIPVPEQSLSNIPVPEGHPTCKPASESENLKAGKKPEIVETDSTSALSSEVEAETEADPEDEGQKLNSEKLVDYGSDASDSEENEENEESEKEPSKDDDSKSEPEVLEDPGQEDSKDDDTDDKEKGSENEVETVEAAVKVSEKKVITATIPVEKSEDLFQQDVDTPDLEGQQSQNEDKAASGSTETQLPVESEPNEVEKLGETGVEVKEKLFDGEDESSIQGDVLDIEAEGNLQDANSITDEHEVRNGSIGKANAEKSDGLVDITDEEMSEFEESSEAAAQKSMNLNTEAISEDEGSIDISLIDTSKTSEQPSGSTLPGLPGLEGLQTDPISDSEGNVFDELNYSAEKQSEHDGAKKRKKKKKSQKEYSASETDDANMSQAKEKRNSLDFEEGEIVDDKPKTSSKDRKKKAKDKEGNENIDKSKSDVDKEKDKDKKQKKSKDSKTKDSVLQSSENKTTANGNKEKSPPLGISDVPWKKLSKNTKDRNYRDTKNKNANDKAKKSYETSQKDKDKKTKEKRKELERYNVRKVLGEKVRLIGKDDFGRDLSLNRSMSRSKSRSRSRSRNRIRGRGRSRSRSPLSPLSPLYRSPLRSRIRRSRSKSRSRSRSRRRLGNKKRSRSKDKALRRSYNRNRSKSRNRSKEKSRKKKPSKERHVSPAKSRSVKKKKKPDDKKRNRSYSPVVSPARKRRSISRFSWSPSWSSYSYSGSVGPYSRSYSLSPTPSWSSENRALVYKRNKARQAKNITVIVPNADTNAKKKDKKRASKKNKENEKRKKKRERSPAPSKEVFTSGDNILVSVNFSNNKNDGTLGSLLHSNEYSARRKSREVEVSTKKSKQERIKEKKSKSASAPQRKNRSARTTAVNEAAKNAKPIAIIDLNMSPFREETPSPKEVIVVTDSDLEGGNTEHDEAVCQNSSSREIGQNSVSQPESPVSNFLNSSAGGPKTPPEPRIAFSISTKQPQIRTMINPLMTGEEEEEQIEEGNNEAEMSEIFSKGPNTPPEPPPDTNTPASPPTTPYDPFDPTKSRSPSPELGDETSTSINLRDGSKQFDSLSPSVIESTDLDSRNKSSPQLGEESKKTPEGARTQKDSMPSHDSPKQVSPNLNSTGESSDGVVLKILSHAKVDLTTYKSPEHKPSTPKSSQLTPKSATPSKQINSRTPTSANKLPIYTPAITLNGEKLDDAPMDISGDSPYSPGPYEVDDLFEPPPISPPRVASKLPMPPIIRSSLTKANQSKFDALFGTPPRRNLKPKPVPYTPKPIIPSIKGTKAGKTSKGAKKEVGVKMDEDQLKILDDLPSSAVEMQVKDKYLKKLNRQERVVEEVKFVLKPHYAKKHISKEDYKEILRRAVPKICHNRSGEINPMKIQMLIEAYVRKFRAKTSKKKGATENTNATSITKRPKVGRS